MSDKDLQEKLARLSPEKRQILLEKLQQAKKEKPEARLNDIKRKGLDFVELSYAQQRLWFLNELEGPGIAYNMPALFSLKGYLNLDALQLAIEAIISRHEMMRTIFTEVDGVAYQKIIKPFKYSFEIDDISNESIEDKALISEKIINNALLIRFDLKKAPLFLVKIIKLKKNEAMLLINMHHIISDGWSTGVLVSELSTLYNGYCKGEVIELNELEVQYSDYSSWQREFLESNLYKKKVSFWEKYLEGVPVLELPLDKPRPVVQSTRGARQPFVLNQDEIKQIKKISEENNTTVFNSLLAIYFILLHRYTGQEDIAVGVPVANRGRSEIEPLIGFFVNTVTLRQKISGREKFTNIINNLKNNFLKVFDNQEIPFEKLVDDLDVVRDMSQSPLFQTLFNYQEQQVDSLKMSNIDIEFMPTNMPTAKFDITMSFTASVNKLEGEIEYNTDLFEKNTIQNMIRHYKHLVRSVMINSSQSISRMQMLSQEDCKWLKSLNNNAVEYENKNTIHQLIEGQSEKTPNNIAVIHGVDNLSYQELNERANQLARYLQEKGINESKLVGVCLERSADFIISILAILKSGAAYVPLDPFYPKQRLEFMVSDSGISILISKKDVLSLSKIDTREEVELVELDEQEKHILKQSTENLIPTESLKNLLYVIYTSGSTGLPKCTGATHQAERNLLQWYTKEFNLNDQDRVLLLSAIGFDLTQKNIFAPLTAGAALVIPDSSYFELDELLSLISTTRVTWINCAPSAFYPLAESEENFKKLNSLRCVFLGGEPIKHQRLRLWNEQTSCQLINSYGPTECTDIATYHCLTNEDWISDRSISIGIAIPNVQLFILGKEGEIVPPGAIGELCIGGVSVGPGYLKDKILSKKKFVDYPDLFASNNSDKKIYKTGDRVRFRKNGSLEYLGRFDHQVKIRGFRIELGEIESQLNELKAINESAVLVKEDPMGNSCLVAFIVFYKDIIATEENKSGKQIESNNNVELLNEVKRKLKEKLPDYMLPVQYAILDALPLTSNGKIDRKSLLALEILSESNKNEYIAIPVSDKEKCLAKIWCEVLNLTQVDIYDNFFNLGGDSILSIQIVTRARRSGLNISARQIFENQNIADLAKAVEWGDINILAEQGLVEGSSLLNPVQQWFFEEPIENPDQWNQSVLLELEDDVLIEHVEKAVQVLIKQHDVLRLNFKYTQSLVQKARHKLDNGEGQEEGKEKQYKVCSFEVDTTNELEKAIQTIQGSLSIENGPLIAIGFIDNKSKTNNQLFVAIHHLVVDGVSWRILLEDLNLLLQQNIHNLSVDIGKKTTSFKDYAKELHNYSRNNILDVTRDYWENLAFQNLPEIPFENPQGENLVSDALTLSIKINNDKTNQLLKKANRAFRSDVNDLLLAALALSVSNWSNNDDILIALEGHGREEFSEKIDLSRTVGWFTTLYPLLLSLPEEKEIGEVIKAIKEQRRAIPNNGFEFGLLKYNPDEDISKTLTEINPQLVFNYLGQLDIEENSNQHFSISDLDFSHSNLNPEGKRKHTIEINGGIRNGILELFWTFSNKQFNKNIIQKLADDFKDQLENIIDYCQLESSYGLTPSDFPLAKISQTELDIVIENQSQFSRRENIIDLYPLSPLQEGMLFHALHEQGSGLYCEEIKLDISDVLDSEKLKEAWRRTSNKYAILRTGFIWEDVSQSLQCVHENVPVSFFEFEMDRHEFNEFIEEELKKGFDLSKPGLIKVYICKNNDNNFTLALLFHHIVLDGWSLSIVLGEFFKKYKELLENNEQYTRETPGAIISGNSDYVSFIKFLEINKEDNNRNEESFWKSYLSNIDDLAELPGDYYKNRESSFDRDSSSIIINEALSKKIEIGSKVNRITTNVFFQGVWALLLSRYSAENDVIFGSTMSGRPEELLNAEEMVGLFINTLPIRVDFALYSDNTVSEFFEELQIQQLEIRKYENSALKNINSWIKQDKNSELFESIFVFESYPIDQALKNSADDLNIESLTTEWKTNYPITLVINPDKLIKIKISYDKQRYSLELINDILENFVNISETLIDNFETQIKQINFLNNKQKNQIIGEWNNTNNVYENNSSIAELFENQVRSTPNNIAIRFQKQSFSYEEINNRANQLADKIIQSSCDDNKESLLVALCTERSVEMIVAILAIIKANAAYVPLDASYPEDRLQYMLKDTGAKLLLLQKKYQNHFKQFEIAKIFLEDDTSIYDQHNKPVSVDGNSLAYIMYTSGSTGKPKGIEVCHKNVIRLVRNTNFIELNDKQVFLQYAPISFDAATLEIWGPLLNGGTLVIAPPGHLEMEELADIFSQEAVNTVWLTAALFHYLVEYHLGAFSKIKQLLAGGDVLSPSLVAKVLETHSGIRVINGYGPTENTTFTCCFPMTEINQVGKTVSIGRPIANTQVYILDEQLKPVAIGMPGELYTAGDGVARGYLNKPDLTEKVFLPNPYAKEFKHGPTIYKTGDMARYLPNGNIEYLGRIDQQVKIRGYRIELGEVETALKQLIKVREVAVIAREDKSGTKKLLAYLVANESNENLKNEAIDNQEIRDELKAIMPDYMIPSVFIWLNKLPVTENGKLDRKALPIPDIRLSRRKNIVNPRNDNEVILQKVWKDVLGVDEIGVFDNYFELGGDSILSIQIVSRAKNMGLIINSRQIFELQIIAELAQQAETRANIIAEQGLVTKSAIQTPIQKWFFEQKFEHISQWNMSVLLKLDQRSYSQKSFEELELIFKNITTELVNQHDIFRSVFKISNGGIKHGYIEADKENTVLKEVFVSYELKDEPKQENKLGACINAIQQSLNIDKGPMFRLALIKINNDEYRIFITAHHLVIDGVSWRILLDDLNILLLAELQKIKPIINSDITENPLGEKTTSFAQWSDALTEYTNSEQVQEQLRYWNSLQFEKIKPLAVKCLSQDKSLNSEVNDSAYNRSSTVATIVNIEQSLSAEKTRQLLFEANKAYQTEINDLLLAALVVTINGWQQEKFCLVDLEGHGREHISDAVDVSRTIGWFTSSFPVLLELDVDAEKEIDYALIIKSVKEQLHSIPDKGLGYGLLKYSELNTDSGLLRENRQSEINFNYLGQIDNTFNKESLLLPANEIAGQDRHPGNHNTHLLDIFGIILNEQLTIGWRFGNEIFETKTIEKLVKRNKEVLENIIEFCLVEENKGFTPSDFPLTKLEQKNLDAIVQNNSDIEDLYPLSAMQQGLLFHAQMESETGVYFEQHIVELKGELNRELFSQAWASVIKKYEILRTSFIWENQERPLQIVHKHCEISIDFPESVTDFDEFIRQDRIRGFDLEKAPLTRIALIPVKGDALKMVWSFHHILLDGWSVSKIIADVFLAYELLNQGLEPNETKSPKYVNYIAWLENIKKNEARNFWSQYLSGFESVTPLGMQSQVTLPTKTEGEAKPIKDYIFDKTLNNDIEDFCKKHHLTTNTVFQAVWAYLLGIYSGTQDIVFGATVSGRPADLQGVEDMVGLFINTIPMRIFIEDDQSILEWLTEIQQKQIEVRAFESTPLYDVQQYSELNAENPLFESLLVFENYPVSDVLKNSSMSIEFSNISSVEQTNFPLTIVIMPGEQLEMRIAYEASGFSEIVIDRLFRHFSQVLKNIISNPLDQLKELSATDSEEINKLVGEWNKTTVTSNIETSVITEFEKCVKEYPHHKAVVDDKKEYTYAELNKKANKIARLLENSEISKGDFVAIIGSRSTDLLAGIIGIVKTGAAYIPIDPGYPVGRVKHILQDAKVKAVISTEQCLEKLKDYEELVLNLDDCQDQLEQFSECDLNTVIDKDDIAYCIYTSGSTGEPKGVLIQHKALKNLCNWQNRKYEVTEKDNISLIASEGFDASICEIWPSIIKGACLFVSKNEIRIDPEALIEWLNKNKINVLFLPTPIAESLLSNNASLPDSIRVLWIGGDRLTVWPEKNLKFKFYNAYGPTEATVVTTTAELNNIKGNGLPPIGRPIDNFKVYVLDRNLSIVPIGAPGELFIGGAGLAYGYLNQEKLTKESFIQNPFSENLNDRLYRTGDLVRYEEDGNFKFMGRIKKGSGPEENMTRNQVKIRGFRIELGEIEAVLDKQKEIKKAIVTAQKYNGQLYLSAYVIPEKEYTHAIEKLPNQLKIAIQEFLPEYMIPSAIIVIEAVPLTFNGKIDYEQLPTIDFQQLQLAKYVEPRSKIECEIVEIWQAVLGMERIGIYDDFFELGGHSILITKINSRIKEKLNIHIPLKILFEMSTIAAQAELIETLKWQENNIEVIEDQNEDDYEEGTL